MTLENFKAVMALIDKADKRNDVLYQEGIDVINYCDVYHDIISKLLEGLFGEEGLDWISYYLYEIPMFKDKEEFYATEADGTPIYLRNPDELYSFLLKSGYVKS